MKNCAVDLKTADDEDIALLIYCNNPPTSLK
jgi:hypothetical protein